MYQEATKPPGWRVYCEEGLSKDEFHYHKGTFVEQEERDSSVEVVILEAASGMGKSTSLRSSLYDALYDVVVNRPAPTAFRLCVLMSVSPNMQSMYVFAKAISEIFEACCLLDEGAARNDQKGWPTDRRSSASS